MPAFEYAPRYGVVQPARPTNTEWCSDEDGRPDCCVIPNGDCGRWGRQVAAILKDAAHWKERAEDARRVAAQLADPEDRAKMLEIAENYERLAVRAQVRADDDSSGYRGS